MVVPPAPIPVFINTGKGVCQACGCRDIREMHIKDATDTTTSNLLGCLMIALSCGLLLPVVIIMALGQVNKRTVGLLRTCNVCGHQWRI